MRIPESLQSILERIAQHQQTAEDLEVLRRSLHQEGELLQWVSQDGKFNVNIGEIVGGQVHIGDRTTLSDEQIQAIAQAIREQLAPPLPLGTAELPAIDELVQQVRSRIHDDIQRLHGTMPLWGVDHWVPLGELFVDVNILEEVSSNRRSELPDLWQDFNQNPGYRGLDRMGLGKERQRVSGLAVLDRNTNLMVVGKPGSGKTTYLQRVVTECNAGNLQAQRIPVLIRLREFVDDGRGVDYAVERYLERCWRLSAIEVKLVLDAGRSLVLLDGVDEVTGADGQAIVKQIKRFARDYPQVQVIVTCRTQSQESRFERFDAVEVADFDESQVSAFSEHWFQTVCGDLPTGQARATAFLDQLFREENEPIQELVITPILLSLTCAVFQQTRKFYSKRSKLYEEGLELLLEQWDRSREIERDEVYRDLSVERKLELLSYLAVKKFEQEQYVLFEQTEIEGYIAEFLGIGVRESRGVLRAIESQHGLLIERSIKIWSFSHLTFQEYLVAKWFCNRADFQKLANHTAETEWKEVFLLVVEILLNADTLLNLMKVETDRLLAKDEDLQKFLVWVNGKSQSVTVPYEFSAIRAFYFELTLGFELAVEGGPKLAYNTAIDSDFSLTNALCPNYCIGDNFDLAIDYFLSCAICLIIDQSVEIMETICDYPELDKNLKQQFQQFLDEVYKAYESEETWDEWITEGEEWWFTVLRDTIAKYRNILHYWEFTEIDIQSDILNQYYYANQLLIKCIHQSENLNVLVEKEIKETLLWPIAEIEKRNREKTE